MFRDILVIEAMGLIYESGVRSQDWDSGVVEFDMFDQTKTWCFSVFPIIISATSTLLLGFTSSKMLIYYTLLAIIIKLKLASLIRKGG